MPFRKILFCLLLSAVIFNTNYLPVCAQTGRTTGTASGLKDDALYEAVLAGDTKKAADLLNKGVFAGKKWGGKPLLMYAIREKHQDIAKLLISKGADQNGSDDNDETVLMYAAENGNKEVVNLLLSKGAITSRKDKVGRIALMYALSGYVYRTKNDPYADYFGTVKVLLSKCSDINYRDHSYNTLLMYAVRSGCPEIVKLLLSKGAQVNFENSSNQTALGIAEESNYYGTPKEKKPKVEIVNMLKAAGGHK